MSDIPFMRPIKSQDMIYYGVQVDPEEVVVEFRSRLGNVVAREVRYGELRGTIPVVMGDYWQIHPKDFLDCHRECVDRLIRNIMSNECRRLFPEVVDTLSGRKYGAGKARARQFIPRDFGGAIYIYYDEYHKTNPIKTFNFTVRYPCDIYASLYTEGNAGSHNA